MKRGYNKECVTVVDSLGEWIDRWPGNGVERRAASGESQAGAGILIPGCQIHRNPSGCMVEKCSIKRNARHSIFVVYIYNNYKHII